MLLIVALFVLLLIVLVLGALAVFTFKTTQVLHPCECPICLGHFTMLDLLGAGMLKYPLPYNQRGLRFSQRLARYVHKGPGVEAME